jgi:hypothetical protein
MSRGAGRVTEQSAWTTCAYCGKPINVGRDRPMTMHIEKRGKLVGEEKVHRRCLRLWLQGGRPQSPRTRGTAVVLRRVP